MSEHYPGGKKNILIIGGAGFIGSHLCFELIKDNNIICLDNFSTSQMENIRFLLENPNFEFIRHNINEPLNLDDLPELKKFQVKIQGIQEIYSFACPTTAKNFSSMVMETLWANSVGLKNVLDMAVKYRAKLTHASSAVVYGPRTSQRVYVNEKDIGQVDFLSPRACYDEGKQFAETMVATYRDYYKLDFKIARIFRTYGPNMMLNDGQMIPDFMLNALDNKPLVIYGDPDFSTSLCYVQDVVQGVIKLMESQIAGPVNLGSDLEVKLSHVAEKIISLTNSKSQVVFEKPLLFMTPLTIPDLTLAKKELDWFPVVSLEQGLEKSLAYIKAFKQLLDTGQNLTE
jgi:UDP-glucuronate decarboxylase